MLELLYFFSVISLAVGDSSINFLAVGDWGGQKIKTNLFVLHLTSFMFQDNKRVHITLKDRRTLLRAWIKLRRQLMQNSSSLSVVILKEKTSYNS